MNDVLVVDDERAVLDSLLSALDWAEFGFKQVRTAQSAQEAMQIMREHPVDLLLLDILMPGMNGLEMLKTIRSRYPQIHCVLISAHSKFEYAQEAIRLNVENYLLKPVDLNELRETVYRAVENINQSSESFHNLFERNVLERWLYGRITSDELVEHSRFTGYNVLMRRYYVLAVRAINQVDGMLHTAVASISKQFPAYELQVDESNGLILTGGRDLTWDALSMLLSFSASNYPGIVIACGSCANGSGEVSKSTADAVHVQEFARLSNIKGFLAYDEINWAQFTPEMRTQLMDRLRQEEAEQKVYEWAEKALGKNTDNGNRIRRLYAHICLALTHDTEEELPQDLILPPMEPPYTLNSFQKAIKKAISQVNAARQRKDRDASPIIRLVLNYINENLTASLSIKQFCAQTKTNAAYIGRLFKEETGMYFSDYISMLRIRKAKMLLETTHQSVGDIARQVGIYDVSYFTQCFKKQVRLSPTQYRQSLQNKE